MSAERASRVTFALRQAAVTAVILVVAGGVVERLRPDEATDRGFLATPFWWAAVLWTVILVFDAVAFERSQLGRLEGPPLAGAILIGIAVLVVGLLTFSEGSTLPRTIYLAANAAGAAVFWWAILGLLWLLRPPPPSQTPPV